MPAHRRNFRVEQTESLLPAFYIRPGRGSTPVTLTGWTARSQWRVRLSKPEALLELTTENGGIAIDADRRILSYAITDEQRASLLAMAYSRLVYDTFLISPTGRRYKVVEGEILLVRSVTHP
ncbi:hypothetical protein MMA231_02484 [Asticcacaulis sp. MM231]|uniref:hypothetical protein n=1 Tax=Asticcacaulis sp. MM231 TaxID=3157666 RepID=UPI0032D568A5